MVVCAPHAAVERGAVAPRPEVQRAVRQGGLPRRHLLPGAVGCRASVNWPNSPLVEHDDEKLIDKLLQKIVAVVPSFPFEVDEA